MQPDIIILVSVQLIVCMRACVCVHALNYSICVTLLPYMVELAMRNICDILFVSKKVSSFYVCINILRMHICEP